MIIAALLLTLVITGFVVKNKKQTTMLKSFKRDSKGRFSKKDYQLVTVNDLRADVGLGRYTN